MEKMDQETMKAAFVEEFNQPLVIRDIPRPPVGEGEVLVKVEACDLSRAAVDIISGKRVDMELPLPFIPGTGSSGTVECIGSKVKKVHPGDHVVVHGIISCGQCSFCLQKRDNLCPHAQVVGRSANGVLAEFIKVPATNVFPVSSDVSFPEAAIISAALATSFHAVREAEIESKHSVAMYGSGSLGLTALLLLHKCSRVVAIDTDEKKLKLAKELGAWETINVREVNPSSAILRVTGGEGVDRALVMVGETQAIQEALLSVKPGGKVVLAGSTPEPFMIKTDQLIYPEISLAGSRYAPKHLIPELILLVAEQRINIKRVISHVLNPLSEVNRGVELVKNENPIKVIIQPW